MENKKKLMLLFLMFSIGFYSMAQQTTITGKVTSGGDGESLPGVTVMVKGTSIGTATDVDGKFSLLIPSDRATLVFSYLGFKVQEVPVNSQSGNLTIAMKEDQRLLDEVVVVGYGTMRKSDISGSSISIGEEKIKGSIITNLDQAFQGRVAGVNSVLTSGAPGSAVSIRVRGIATLNANAEPLYVIDGVIVQGQGSGAGGAFATASPLANINPSDILTMEILKDASATAIYGSLGSNGVVLITTKRGKAGEAKFSYEGFVGVNIQGERLKMMNLREFAEFTSSVSKEYSTEYYGTPSAEYKDPSLLGAGTNWQDAIFQHALIQNHQVSAQGGTDKVRYYVSGNYMGQEGTIIGTQFSRFTFRSNLDADLKSWLKFGLNASYATTKEKFSLANGDEGVLYYSLITPPDVPIYDMDGNYSSSYRENYYTPNPIGLAMMEDNDLERSKLNGNIFFEIRPLKNLVWRSELGYSFDYTKREHFLPTYDFGVKANLINLMEESKSNNAYYQVINNLTYSGKIKKHNYTLMLGQDLSESKWNGLSGSGSGLPSNEIHNLSLSDPNTRNATSYFGSSAIASFLARATYNYDDRYLGTVTFRRDGSSNFGPKNRWANFTAFAVSWRFSNEAFMKSFESFLSNGKIRYGWGQTGNQGIGGYRWGASISQMPSAFGPGYRQANIANPYVQWETQVSWNIGLDLGLFRDRINLVLETYDKTSNNMLMQLDLPSYMGTKGNGSSALSAPWGNYGSINNKGFEVSLNTRNLQGAFEWDTDIQLTFVKNKLVSLAPGTPPLMGYPQWGGMGSPITRTYVGEPLYNFYGFVTDGYFKDRADIDKSPKTAAYPKDGSTYSMYNTVWVGDIKFKDISGPDGKPDGIIDDYDRTDLGSPLPKFQFGMNNSFRYKNFDLNLFINGSYGNKLFNYVSINLTRMSGYTNQLQVVTDRARVEPKDVNKVYDGTNGIWNWFQDIDNVKLANNPSLPRALHAGDPNNNTRFSDRYLEDGSYLRIKNIVFGYTFPSKLTRKFQVENLRIYANIQNLHTFTKYTGYDPEVGINTMTPNVFGMDNGRYPSPQSYTFGLNISF